MNRFHADGVWSPENNITQNGSTWAEEFFSFCQQAATDDEVFKTFKQHPAFTSIIGSDIRNGSFAQQCLGQITNPEVLKLLPLFSSGDKLGDPFVYSVEGLGSIAPGTAYHASILNDILEKIGDIKGLSVVEIGPGYGGQAKVMLDYGIESCTLVDILSASNLQRKYLGLLGYKNTSFWDANNIGEGEWDLAISNWCLSEFNNEGISFYVDRIISKCKAGYFWMNMWDTDRKEFVLNLIRKYFTYVEVFEESVKTHGNSNWLLVVKK